MALALGLKMKIGNLTALVARVLETGLKAWHKFTASAWTGVNRLPDSSGNSNTGALFTGRGLSFDGVNDVVTVGATGVTVKTVVFYAYPDTTTTAFMQLQSTGAVRIEIASGTLSATGFTSPTLYVNGAASSTVAATAWQQIAITSATGVSASNVLFGQSNAAFLSGDLSDIKFFSIELSAAQIAELYANPEQALPTGASASELVGWWPMCENSTSAVLNYSSNIGGIVSGATPVASLSGGLTQLAVKGVSRKIRFDGSNDYISTASVSPPLLFSMSIWITPETYSRFLSISAMLFGLDSSTVFNYYPNTGAGPFSLTHDIKLGETAHIVITHDAVNTARYYKNGVLKQTMALGLPINTAAGIVTIGKYVSGGSFTGVIWEVAYWNTALSASEVAAVYNSGKFLQLNANSGNYVSSSNLQSWWINSGAQNADWVDLAGALNGTVNGSPSVISLSEGVNLGLDFLGHSLKTLNTGQLILNGDGYASISDAATLDITSSITLESWIKPFQVSAAQTIIGKNSAYALNITSGAKLQFQRWSSTASGTVSSSASLVVDTWKHVAAVYNGTTTVLYFNGVQDTSSGSVTGAIDATSTDVLMGALTTSTQLFSGYLDSVKVYDAALTASQVLTNYNAEKSTYGL